MIEKKVGYLEINIKPIEHCENKKINIKICGLEKLCVLWGKNVVWHYVFIAVAYTYIRLL